MTVLLSIGMIVKNEEKYLERCLTALKPILDNVSSELIIADTGSTDNTVRIAKKFTDKVYYFEWMNDFSAAINFTLEKSKGEWYMFIDADEILQSCDGVIQFFNSGEYKKFKTAAFVVRSYSAVSNGRVDTSRYVDGTVLRLTERAANIVFVNTVHETFSQILTPVKYLELMADHYGYMFEVDGKVTEKSKEKSRRNLDLLFKRAERLTPAEKKHTGVYKEIADCLKSERDYEKALEYLKTGLAETDESDMIITSYYAQSAGLLLFLNRYKETAELCDRYFEWKRRRCNMQLACDAVMLDCRGGAYYCLKDYYKAVSDLSKFFEVYGKYLEGRLNTDDLLYVSLHGSNEHLRQIILAFLESCAMTRNYNAAGRAVGSFPIFKYLDNGEITFRITTRLADILYGGDPSLLDVLCQNLDIDNRELLISLLRLRLFKNGQGGGNCEDISNTLQAASKSNAKLSSAFDICREYLHNGTADKNKIGDFLKKYGSANCTDILCIMLEQNMDIAEFLNDKGFDANRCAYALGWGYGGLSEPLAGYDTDNIGVSGLDKAAELYKSALTESAARGEDISPLFKKYGSVGESRIRRASEKNGVPKEIEPAIFAYNIARGREKKDYRLCLNEMRKLVAGFPEFAPIVKAYQTLLEQEIQPVKKPPSEFERMALAVKQNIKAMIEAGNIPAAKAALTEYEALCPGDSEIAGIKARLSELL